jgi:hypothetical protein
MIEVTMPDPSLPFGLRDVKVYPVDNLGNRGAGVDLPVAQIFSFKETEVFEVLKGDDQNLASHGGGPMVNWTLDSGGISLAAYQVMMGGAIVNTGTSPTSVKTYTKLTTDQRPYFDVEGQVISDSGGDFHCIVYRCKADGGFDGSFDNSKFMVSKASGSGFGDNVGPSPTYKLYDFVQNETVTAIVP